MSVAAFQQPIIIAQMPWSEIVGVMPRIEELLQQVVKPQTGHTLDSVLQDVVLKQTQLWSIDTLTALSITRIQQRPVDRVLWNEWIVGDNMEAWLSNWLAVQEDFAREQGCAAIEFNGRRGYRKYEKYGKFKPLRTLYRQELT